MLDATRLRVLVAVARHGSVTAAAHALNYAQPSISHHIAKLEAETGVKLMERAGRGVRLTEAGQLLADRAEEILGRLDAAEAELAAHVGLRQGRVRLAAFPSALGTLVPAAAARLQAAPTSTDLMLTEAEPAAALRMLRAGLADVALIFRYHQEPASTEPDPLMDEEEGIRTQLVLDEPVYLITGPEASGRGGHTSLMDYASHRWIGGCARCREFLLQQCACAGFTPNIAFTTDDYVAAQALVAAGLGVTLLPGLALRAARHRGITATPLPGSHRHILAVTYGQPPDPPASVRLIEALRHVASSGQAADGDQADCDLIRLRCCARPSKDHAVAV